MIGFLSTLRTSGGSLLQTRTNVNDLRPQVAKVRKTFKGFFKLRDGGSLRNTLPVKGEYVLTASEGGRLKDKQIDAARTMLRAAIKPFKQSKFHLACMPNQPFTSKGQESRMGKGKGPIDHWGKWVDKGEILFEVYGLAEQAAERALKIAGNAFHIRTEVKKVSKDLVGQEPLKVLPRFIAKRLQMQEFIDHDQLKNRKDSFKEQQSHQELVAKEIATQEALVADVKSKYSTEEIQTLSHFLFPKTSNSLIPNESSPIELFKRSLNKNL